MPALDRQTLSGNSSANAASNPRSHDATLNTLRLGRFRWVIERTFAWLHQFRRLLVRYDRRVAIHHAFLALGCCIICRRRLADTN